MKIILHIILLIILFICSSPTLFGQIDSMLKVLEFDDISNRERILTHNRCAAYYATSDTTQFLKHKGKLEELAISTNDSLGKFLFNTLNVIYYNNQEKLDMVDIYLKKNIKQAQELGNPKFISGTLYELAILKSKLNQRDSAIYYCEKVYQFDKNNEDVHPLNFLRTISFLGSLYKQKLEYNKALLLYFEGDSIVNNMDSSIRSQYKNSSKAEINNAIASLYKTMKDTSLSFNYYYKAIGFLQKTNNQKQLSSTYLNLANLHQSSNNDSCLYYLDKAHLAAKKLVIQFIWQMLV